jgi:uncharacterized membrane protein
MKAARPPGLSTAKDLGATSPPTVSKTASQLATALREIPGVVVDDVIGAEASHICIVPRTRGRDHTSSNMLGKVHVRLRIAVQE